MYVTIILSLSWTLASATGSRQHSYAVIQDIISQTRDRLRESINKLESKSGEYAETISEAQTLADKLYEDFSLDVEKIDQAREAAVSVLLFDTIGDSRDCKMCVGQQFIWTIWIQPVNDLSVIISVSHDIRLQG